MNANLRNFALWVIIVLLLLALFTLFQNPGQRTTSQDISFSQLLNEVDQGRVRDVLIQGPEIHGTFTDGRSFQTYAPNDPSLIQRLYGKGVSITARPQQNDVPWFVSLLVSWLPFIALIGRISMQPSPPWQPVGILRAHSIASSMLSQSSM